MRMDPSIESSQEACKRPQFGSRHLTEEKDVFAQMPGMT